MKKILFLLCTLVFLCMLSGCRLIKIEKGERTPLEYTVLDEYEIPEEARNMIEEKKEAAFRMAYQKGKELYLIRGYGRQLSGGYSIQVTELTASDSAIFFGTKLIGPTGETAGGEPSYPYIAVKTEYRKEPVEFTE